MKKLLFILFLFISTICNAQDLVGRKIINGNLNANFFISPNFKSYTFSTTFLYGKIKPNLTYTAFGGVIQTIPVGKDELSGELINQTFVGPEFQKGKFIKIIDKLYLAPYFGGSAVMGFMLGEIGGRVSVEAVPVRFMYQCTDKFMLSASFGSANLSAQHLAEITQINVSGSLSNDSGFGVFYTFK
jgi:hypothetical protein